MVMIPMLRRRGSVFRLMSLFAATGAVARRMLPVATLLFLTALQVFAQSGTPEYAVVELPSTGVP